MCYGSSVKISFFSDSINTLDVHTAPPSPDTHFSGTVLTEAVGNINMMLAAINSGTDVVVYASPVFSHYEIIPSGIDRMADSEWKKNLKVITSL